MDEYTLTELVPSKYPAPLKNGLDWVLIKVLGAIWQTAGRGVTVLVRDTIKVELGFGR